MKIHRAREIQKPEKRTTRIRPKELEKYPEKMKYRDVPMDKQVEKKFSEKHLDHVKEKESTRDKKSEIVEKMANKEASLSPEKKSDQASDFHFADQAEFREEIQEREPSRTDKEIERTSGFHDQRDDQAFVRDKGDTLVTALHEKLHQKSKSDLPTRLNEGITEHWAREKAGAMGDLKRFDRHGKELPKPESDYEREVEIVRKIEAAMGKEPLEKAYFHGRIDVLESHFDSAMGEGAFSKLADALEKRDYKTASGILDKKKEDSIK